MIVRAGFKPAPTEKMFMKIYFIFILLLFPSIVSAQTLDANLSQAKQLTEEGKYDRSIDLLFQSMKLAPLEPRLHLELGRAYLGRELLELATESLQKSIGLDAKQWEPHLLLARTFQNKKWYSQAAEQFEQATTLNKLSEDAHFEAGQLYVRMGDLGKAKKHYSALEKMQSTKAPQLMGLIDPATNPK